MKLQYVFGNPTGSKKRRKKVAKKVRRKKNPRKTKLVAYEPVRIKNLNTGKVTKKKGKIAAKYTTAEVPNKADLHKMRSQLSKARAAIAQARIDKKKIKGKAAKAAASKVIAAAQKAYNQMNQKYKKKIKLRKTELNALDGMIKNLKDMGAIVKTETKYTKGSGLAKKKKRKKATRRKKKSTRKKSSSKKRKTTRKKKKRKTTRRKKASTKKRRTRKKTTKKRRTRKKSSKRKTSRKKKSTRKKTRRKSTRRKKSRKKASSPKGKVIRGYKKRKSKALKKGYAVYNNPKKRRSRRRKKNPFGGNIMKRKNPMSVAGMKVAGYDPMELAELATGGLFYGAANSYISPMFAKIPGLGGMAGMLGGTVPSLTAGILLNMISEKVNNRQVKQAAEFIGDGLLGAAVVGLGVHLSQTMLPPGMSGVDYIPAQPGVDPDYGGVDYTPDGGYMSGMGAVDFTPGQSLPGQNVEADFGKYAYEESPADFGEVPSGLN